MPALPNVPGVIRVSLQHTLGQDLDALVRFYMAYTGTAPTSTQMGTFATSVSTAWGTNLKALACSTVKLVEVTAVDLTSPTAGIGAAAVSITGTRTTPVNSAQVCMLVNFKVSRRYRGGKPRAYLPYGNNADFTDPQTWGSTLVTAVNTGWAAFITALIAAPPGTATLTGQVNVSYFDGFTVVTNPVTGRSRNVPTLRATPVVDSITSIAASARVATQRRRTLR